MSGFLSSALDGLFIASFRGVEFYMPDVRREVGRRIVAFQFPGLDRTVHEDIGRHEGAISVTGLLIGDDYVAQAEAMAEALATPGPGTLSHPWLGDIEVVLPRPATISLTEKEMRIARFEATFERWDGAAPSVLDTLSQVVAAIGAVKREARATLRQVLAPVRLTVAAIAAAQGLAGQAASLWRGFASAGRGLAGMADALEAPLAGLLGAGGVTSLDTASLDYGGLVAERFAAVPAAAAAAAAPALPSALGAGDAAPESPARPEPAAAVALLLDGAVALATTPCLIPALPLVAAIQARAAAALTVGDIPFRDQAEALGWRDAVDAGLALAAADAAGLATTWPGVAAPLWRAVADLRAALAIDFTARFGRLPAVAVLPARAGTVPVWLIAQHLVGADPGAVAAMLDELARRNRLSNPGAVPAAQPLEYLTR